MIAGKKNLRRNGLPWERKIAVFTGTKADFSTKSFDCQKDRLTNGPRCLCCGAKWFVLGSSGLQMLLTGTYERVLDEKLRLALPRTIRDVFRGVKQLVLTPGTDGSF